MSTSIIRTNSHPHVVTLNIHFSQNVLLMSAFHVWLVLLQLFYIVVLMLLLSGSFATNAWHLTSYLGSCHCPWPLISQVCISRDIWAHLPASDWLAVCISGLWLADSVITASPSQSPRLYRVNLSSHTQRQLPPVSGCTAVTSDQSESREVRQSANESSAVCAGYSTDITLTSWRTRDQW